MPIVPPPSTASLATDNNLIQVHTALGTPAQAGEAAAATALLATEATLQAVDATLGSPAQDATLTDGSQKAKVYGENHSGDYPILVDVTGRQTIIETEHDAIHRGYHFSPSSYDTDVDVATPKIWLLTTPVDKELHTIFELESGPAGGLWVLYEAPTVTAPGTAIPIPNTNRNSSNTTTATFTQDGTVSADGEFITASFQGSAGGSVKTGGNAGWRNERVLKPGTVYLLRFTPTANDTFANTRIWFYEVPV